jgi:hypothetical protein
MIILSLHSFESLFYDQSQQYSINNDFICFAFFRLSFLDLFVVLHIYPIVCVVFWDGLLGWLVLMGYWVEMGSVFG